MRLRKSSKGQDEKRSIRRRGRRNGERKGVQEVQKHILFVIKQLKLMPLSSFFLRLPTSRRSEEVMTVDGLRAAERMVDILLKKNESGPFYFQILMIMCPLKEKMKFGYQTSV